MRSEWKRYPLADIVNIIGGGTPKRAMPEYWNGNIPWLSVVDFNTGNRHVSTAKEFITDLGLQKSSTKVLDAGQLIISARGTVGALAQLDKPMAFNQSCYGLDAKIEYTTNDYLYYLVKKKVRDLQQITHGAVFDTITRDTFKQIEVKLPPLPTQNTIAHILSTLDDKIELNRQMNQTLEEMAQALFKFWFVDFDPVHAKAGCTSDAELEQAAAALGISKEVLELFPSAFVESEMGMIPEGWEVSTIEDEVTIYGGATPSTKEDKYWVDGSNHWATPRDLSGLNSKVLIDTGRKITDDGVNKISSKQLPIGTILLSSRAPVGYIAYSTVPISINQGFIAMVCKKKLSNYYMMYWLDIAMNEIKNRAIGTTFSEISKSAFRPIKLVVSSDEVIISFDTIVAPMVKKLIENEREIETLQKIRDTLLPKLLSGELDVSKLNIVEEH